MGKYILFVDDDRTSLELVTRRLQENGYDAQAVANGVEALLTLKQRIPDLIVLDVEMPLMNGYGFITELRKIEPAARVPVIMLTGHEETEPLFKRYGIRAYLVKPLNMQLLLTTIKEVLGE